MDDPAFDAPSCPDCGTVLVDDPAGLRCRGCGYVLEVEGAPMPPEFEGPSIYGG